MDGSFEEKELEDSALCTFLSLWQVGKEKWQEAGGMCQEFTDEAHTASFGGEPGYRLLPLYYEVALSLNPVTKALTLGVKSCTRFLYLQQTSLRTTPSFHSLPPSEPESGL